MDCKYLYIDNIKINFVCCMIEIDNKVVDVMLCEFDVVEFLFDNMNKIVLWQVIQEVVWGCEFGVLLCMFDIYILWICLKLQFEYDKNL